jgi:hypothetical protein
MATTDDDDGGSASDVDEESAAVEVSGNSASVGKNPKRHFWEFFCFGDNSFRSE